MSVDCDLETTTLDIRQRINQIVEINPARHHSDVETIVSGRNAEKDLFLPRDVNPFTQQFRKQFWQPWATRKHANVGNDFFAGSCSDRIVDRRCNRFFPVINTDRSRCCSDNLHRASSQQHARIGLENAPRNLAQCELRITSRELDTVQLFMVDAESLQSCRSGFAVWISIMGEP